jgi:CTP:molybdopterin cytidylyltransferase MocA
MIAAALLAAGASRRLSRPKQLLPCRGAPLVRAVASELSATCCDRVVVVLGAHAGVVAPALAGLPIALEVNVLWSEGIASSIRCAVAWALRAGCDRLALVACDQPRLRAAHVDALIALHRTCAGIVASRYAGVAGTPAVFGASDFPSLVALAGDSGARHLLASARTIDWPAGAYDVDTPEDVAREMLRLEG